MHDRARSRRPARHILLVVLAAMLSVGTSVSFTAAGTAPSGVRSSPGLPYRTANGVILQAGTPLPIFAMHAPTLSTGGVSNLSQQFSNIYNRQGVQTDSYRSMPRYTVPNTATNSLLEQYSATGGFNAYNAKAAFSETAQGTLTTALAEQLACNFLFKPNSPNRSFINVDGTLLVGHATGVITPQATFLSVSPPPPNCSKPGYKTSLIWSNSEASGVRVAAAPQPIGAVVEVTMTLNTGQFSQTPQVPLGGAGGHLSLLFRPSPVGGPPSFTLDSSVAGLAAISMPFYGRSLNFTRLVPAVDPVQVQAQVQQRVLASYPTATNVNVPTPSLLYMADEAGSSQKALEPDLNFQGIQVTVGGVTFTLKDINVPAVQSGTGGFGPNVGITSPANGSTFTPGNNVTLNGTISGGTTPYSYTWELEDGTPLKQGTLAAAGSVSLTTNQLPAVSHNGIPAATMVILRATDNEGAVRTATVSLNPSSAPVLFLPVVQRPGAAQLALQSELQAQPAPLTGPAAINYSFGIESGSDYPPYGPGGADLSGVPPDANGFRSGMLGYGWSQRFYWSNASAWERDWRDCSLGGGDCSYGVDRADFVYYTGHGSNGGISLPSNVDSSWFPGTNARYSTLRWVGFSSCLTLRAQWPTPGSEPIRNWFNAFRGAHMLLGFNSVMADIAFGGPLVDNMRMPTFFGIPFPWAQRTIREAWVLTAFNMNAGKPAYIYAVGNGVNPVDNKLPQASDPLLPRPYPVSSWHWVWWDE